MKIKQLREWVNTIPQEFDETDLVFRKIMPKDSENWLAKDKSIAACGIDAGNNKAYFCMESDAKTIEKN